MKVYLLSIDNRRFFFYADESAAAREDGAGSGSTEPAASGWWGQFRDRFDQLKQAWEHSEARVARWTRRSWEWLHSWAHPDESMLARLRSARRIDLHHPATRTGDEVRSLWRGYLNRRWWRHTFWMSLNSVLAPFTVVLGLLPGPNVICYWIAYRAIHHALIVWGIQRVWRERIRIELHPLAALDRPLERDEGGKARHAAIDGEAAQLDEHVAWSESEAGAAVAGPELHAAAVPEKPAGPGSAEYSEK